MKASTKNAGKTPVGSHKDASEIGHITRFATLGDNYCYIFDPRTGGNKHVRVDSEQFWTVINEIMPKLGKNRLLDDVREQVAKNPTHAPWKSVLTKMESDEEE